MKRTIIAGIILIHILISNNNLYAIPEAFEVGPATQDQLPGGKEADGIIGDFIMRNNLIEAVIAHNAHLRKANMMTNWEELIRNSKRGQILMTNRPFLQVET